MKKIIFIYCLSYLIINNSTAQDGLIPPSPSSQAFQTYGEYPVSYGTGVPDISIPLYTIDFQEVQVPIVLRYHIRNVKPDYNTNRIGFGWILDYGGEISRTIKGQPDDTSVRLEDSFINGNIDQNQWSDVQKMDYALNGQRDGEYDIFNYSFPKGNGKFIIEKQTNNYKAKELEYHPYKFNFFLETANNTASGNKLKTISLIDDKGVEYIYGNGASENVSALGGTTAFSTWKLKTIKSSAGYENIEFNYASIPINTVSPLTKYGGIGLDDPVVAAEEYSSHVDLHINPNISCDDPYTDHIVYNEKTIKKIEFPNGTIDFQLEDNNRSIKSISIYNKNKLIKRIAFYRSKFNNSYTDHIRLDSIKVYEGNLKNPKVYSFEYNSKLITNRDAVDFWGYYNGRNDGCTDREYTYIDGTNLYLKLPRTTTPFVGDRRVNSELTKAQTLEKIIYPTGGSSQFIYENNRYGANNTLGGGLRIKSIINNDGHSHTIKNYNYGEGFIVFPLNNKYYYTTTSYDFIPIWDTYTHTKLQKFISYRNRKFSNSINPVLGENGVKYKMVEEVLGGSGNPVGKSVYHYSYENENYYKTYLSGIPNDEGKIVPDYLSDWGNGLMVEKEIYKNKGGALVKVLGEKLDYRISKDAQIKKNLKVFNLVNISNSVGSTPEKWRLIQTARHFNNYGNLNENYNLYGSYKYGIRTGRVQLLNRRKVEYFQNGEAIDSTVVSLDYQYNNNNYISQVSQLQSNGYYKKVNYKFPSDFQGETVYDSMIEKNMLNFPIEIITSDKGTFSSKQHTSFKNWGVGVFSPQFIKFQKKDGYLNTNIEYKDYDSYGNPIELSKSDGPNIFYLWGYHGQYPIAKIENTNEAALEAVLGELKNVNETDLSAINNLRSNSSFKSVMITTYTYEPLVGMTSMTDPRGRTTTYHYDDFGRLDWVKDHEGKLLEEYEYHYKGE